MISNGAALPADALDAAAAADNAVNSGLAAWLRQARRVHTAYGVSIARQALGIISYWMRLGTRRREYYLYRLYDPAVPPTTKRTFLSNARWDDLVDRINPRAYHYLVDDKTAFGTTLRRFGIATAAIHDVFDVSRTMFLSGSGARDAAAFARHVRSLAAPGIVIKDEEGRQGHHVHVLQRIDDRSVLLADGRRLGHEEFFARLTESGVRRFVVQERLRPHPDLRPLAGETLATIRLVTYIDDPGDVRALRATMRVPLLDAGVDNFSAGNLAAPIDLTTGVLGQALERETGRRHALHPRTGAPLEGFAVPDWPAVLLLVARAALAFDRLPTIGWDVAITASGPVLVEGNSRYQLNVIQMPHGRGVWEGDFRRWCEARAGWRRGLPR